jgi:hypothetical protein
MDSSRFVQLSPGILLEYVYTDQSNPEVFNTATYPIELMQDDYTNSTYMFNFISVESTMGNSRDNSAASVSAKNDQYVSLNTSVGVPYNDYDPKFTPTPQLPQTFTPNINIQYDTVRVHFVAGFNFDGYDGVIFEVLAPRRDSVLLSLSTINFLKTDTPIFNPDPFLLGEKLYATYIEWRVPALYYMVNSFSPTNPNTLAYKLTDAQGFLSTPPITIKAQGIANTFIDNGYSFYNVEQINQVSLLNRDIFDNLYASVEESVNGDYYEISGQVVGSSLSDFIATLNSSGGDYIVIHQINVSEQIGVNFISTSDQMFTQTDNFDEPVLFRPIILNSAIAASFAINYTLRLFNKNDNTQIIKKARLVSFDPKKYGRRIMKINLGTVPTVAKVYNKIVSDNGNNITIVNGGSSSVPGQTSNQVVEQLVVQTQFVTSFRDRINIKAAISPVKVQNLTTINGN